MMKSVYLQSFEQIGIFVCSIRSYQASVHENHVCLYEGINGESMTSGQVTESSTEKQPRSDIARELLSTQI